MVECPVCGKWLKNTFALNGHISLKGDNLHQAYFESHKKQIPNKDTTNIENKLQKLILLVKEKGDLLETQYNNLLFILNEVVERLIKSNPNLTRPIVQKEAKKEIPEIKEEDTVTFADLIRKYGSIEKVIEYVDHYPLADIIDKDPYLSAAQKREYRDMSRQKWPRL